MQHMMTPIWIVKLVHFKSQKNLGLSPVKIEFDGKERKGLCRWIVWDLDFEQSNLTPTIPGAILE